MLQRSTVQKSFHRISICFSAFANVCVQLMQNQHEITCSILHRNPSQTFLLLGCARHCLVRPGPQFTSKLFEDLSKEWGFQHITSSPMYPQSNGKAEATVKSTKKFIQALWKLAALDEHNYIDSSSSPVPQHTISAGLTILSAEALWTAYTGHTPSPSSLICTTMASKC